MLALVTAATAARLDSDLPLLCGALPEAVVTVWDDPEVDWSGFDAAIIRSTWDYPGRRDEFLAWARRVAAQTALWNPVDVIEWNTDKRYLFQLANAEVPIVPTRVVTGSGQIDGVELDGDIVVKPAVGAGSVGVRRCRHDPVAAAVHIHELLAGGLAVLVQPYLGEVDADGETCVVCLGGELSHAARKNAILARTVEWESGLYAREVVVAHEVTPAERALVEHVLARLPSTAYARIDLLPSADGPVVLEVELCEPSLFLDLDPGSPARAAAVFRSLVQ